MKRLLLPLFLLLTNSLFAADDLERAVSLMAKIGSANAPSFSPDGSRIAFLTNISGVPQAWTMAAEGGWPDQVTALDDPVTRVLWSPDGQWLALEVAPGGGLNGQVYVVRADGSGLRRLTEGGKENNQLEAWTHDGKSVVVASNRRSGAAIDTWLVDAGSGKMRLVAQTAGIGSVDAVSSDDRFLLLERLASRGDNNVYRVALDGSGEVLLTRHDPPATFDAASFAGARADVVYLAGNPERDRSAFGRVTIGADGKASPFEVLAAREDAELASFAIDDAGTFAVLQWNVGGRNELSLFDLRTLKPGPAPKLPSDIVSAVEISRDGKRIALALSGSAAPVDIWMLDACGAGAPACAGRAGAPAATSGSLKQVTRSPHAGIDLSQLVRPELVAYPAADGLQLSGWLYRPRNAQPPYPTVFSFHGGPESQERPTFSTQYQALLANGIAVFAPNVRGSSGFGKKFVNLDNGALRVNGVRDIKATVDAIVGKGIADPKRLGIMGGSYGGYMVMAGVTEYPDLFAAGADLFGVVNFETFFAHSEPWMAAISTVEYGDPATQREMLRSLSPINKVDRVKTPLLVLHGANDTNVPVVEAEQVVTSLEKREIPVDYVLFPDEGHGWRKTANRIRSAVHVTRFFVERLRGGAGTP